ncbi:MAG: hypothetical protein JJT78_15795 [Leptospira sp.]|nr:hypothetical protein [Leptospira sp.]
MHTKYIFKSLALILSLFIVQFFSTGCNRAISEGDRVLFGLSEIFGGERRGGDDTEEEAIARTCTSDVTITTRNISLSEDGNVAATFNQSSDNLLTEVVTSPPAWGYSSFETCIYPNSAFTGSIEFPLTTNDTHSGRFNVSYSHPASMNGDPLPEKMTFTGEGVSARQCFQFTVIDDAIRNPVEDPYRITFGDIIQKDNDENIVNEGFYTGKFPCSISLTVEDDEGPGIRVSNISRIMEEPGPGATATDATFSVVLRLEPTHNVTITINDTWDPVNVGNREGIASPTTLTFTPANYATPQIVTVTSVDDLEVDGLKIYTIRTNPAVSADPEYNGLKPRDVVVYNLDQSVPGYSWERFNGTTGLTDSSGGTINGFATDEANQMGTTYANYRIRLRSKPTANVTLNLTSNCGSRCNLLTSSLTFTPSNWNTFQNIQVEGASDGANNGNQDYNINFTVTSSDNTYANVVSKPVFRVRSCDNDHNALIQPCNFSGSPLGTSGNRLSAVENTPANTTHIWLISQSNPGTDAVVPLSSSDTTEGTVPANVTINSGNYNRMETSGLNRIVLTHVDDFEVDGNQNWTVLTAESTGGIVYNPINIFAETRDNEQWYYTRVVGNTSEDTTTTATIHVCLGANNPDQPVTINLACQTYTSGDRSFGECNPASLPASITFPVDSQVAIANMSNNACQNDPNSLSFTVTGLDDSWADGTVPFNIVLTKAATTDSIYASAPNPGNVTVNNHDNEPAGKRIFVTPIGFQGEMTAEGVRGADTNCNNNRPSGVSSGVFRALTVSNGGGGAGNPQYDRVQGVYQAGDRGWPIKATLHYYLCVGSGYSNCSDEHQRIFIADGAGNFNPTGMVRDFSTNINDEFWTGMNVNLSAATQAANPTSVACDLNYRHNCHGFTYINCPLNPNPALYGQIWKNEGGGSISSDDSLCSASKKLICVEQ